MKKTVVHEVSKLSKNESRRIISPFFLSVCFPTKILELICGFS
jgi:hypothetical protein